MQSPVLPWPAAPSGRRALAAGLVVLAAIMMMGGVGIAAYPLYTDMRASHHQAELRGEMSAPSFRSLYGSGEIQEGAPITRIVIPKLGVDTVVVQGVSLDALNAGAGHYPMTPLPGENGNVAIAGHRTMYGKPFNGLDRLSQGDRITLETPAGVYVYEIVPAFGGHANPWVVGNTDWSPIGPTDEAMLTLTTCHPKGSSKQRLVARARLIGPEEA